jgi:hypothetical protein
LSSDHQGRAKVSGGPGAKLHSGPPPIFLIIVVVVIVAIIINYYYYYYYYYLWRKDNHNKNFSLGQ